MAESTGIIQQISVMEMKSYLPEMMPIISREAKTFLETIAADTEPDLTTYMKAIAQRHKIAREWSVFMERYLLVLGPVSALQPFEVGYDLAGTAQQNDFIRSIALTEVCNLIGLPSVAVPVQVVDGLPQVIQLIGPRYHQDLCLDAAQIIEQQQGALTPIEPRDTSETG
jgi:amidase